ncbi:hypothetical protein RintRC_7665 [Richelia intracellularis]|nr:hypothetical protein RintRC_7665 [Richelia intracellularis]
MGTGLAFSVSYQMLVDKHHGQISCSSEEGKSSEFVVEIPILQSNHT